MTNFKIIFDDITKMKCDVIVNAANASLLGGGGVDGAIHKACGEKLLEECRQLNGCLTGRSKLTRSYNLDKQGVYWIIHTVGPIYRNNGSEEKYLRSCYKSVFNIALNYSELYYKQCLEILNKNLYRFTNDRQMENIVKEIQDYIDMHPMKSIAFPSISTGAYSYPLEEACTIALDEILSFINKYPDKFEEISMVCFDKKTYDMFNNLYKKQE